jgi:hypothetical protein
VCRKGVLADRSLWCCRKDFQQTVLRSCDVLPVLD